LKVKDENSRIRIHYSEAWIRGSGPGSTPKCHGSATLVFTLSTLLFAYLEDVGEAVEAYPLHVLHLVDGEGVVLDQLVAPYHRQPGRRGEREKKILARSFRIRKKKIIICV
jgi:hypothetical protein